MFYSSDINKLATKLCDHTVPHPVEQHIAFTNPSVETPTSPNPNSNKSDPQDPRFSLERVFTRGSASIVFSMTRVEDVFEVRIPRCQVTRSIAEVSRREIPPHDDAEWLRAEKDRLKLDMAFTWKGFKDHLATLVRYSRLGERICDLRLSLQERGSIEASTTTSDSAKQVIEMPYSESPKGSITPTQRSSPNANTSATSSRRGTVTSSHSASSSHLLSNSTTKSTISTASLTSLKDLIETAETSLHHQLNETALENLGDIRRAFIITASDTYQRLQASTPAGTEKPLSNIVETLPEWWKRDVHCLPNSNVMVRESEWGSIIAFTLR